MRNPARRNRNIGTSKQGYKKQNKFVIPESRHDLEPYCHKFEKYSSVSRVINNKEYIFIVENTRTHCCHACTIDDLVKIIALVPTSSIEGLNIIILRQPKRKEETLCSVWGRLRYYFELEQHSGPAIILEAIDYSKKIVRSKKQSVEGLKDLKRLKEDGYAFRESKRDYVAEYDIESVRSTQLYRTLLHEIGHYVQYLECVEKPLAAKNKIIIELEKIIDWESDDECHHFNKWEKLTDEHDDLYDRVWEKYDRIPTFEKEKFAFSYADKLRSELMKKQLIPFKRIFNTQLLLNDNLREEDFTLEKSSLNNITT